MTHSFTTKLTTKEIELTKPASILNIEGEEIRDVSADINWSCRIIDRKGSLEICEFSVDQIRLSMEFEREEDCKYTRTINWVLHQKWPFRGENPHRRREYEMKMEMQECPIGLIEPNCMRIDLKAKTVEVLYEKQQELIDY